MMFELIKKEVRQLIPPASLMFFFIFSDVIYRLFDGRLDEASWSDICGFLLPGEPGGFVIIFTFFCFMIAYSLFPREHDDGTIDFLYSLPVKRISVFAAKITAGFFLLTTADILGHFQDWVLNLLNPQFFSGNQFRIDIAITSWLLTTAYIFILLSYGVLISFFRRFGLILFGIYWWAVYTFEKTAPMFAYFNFVNIIKMEYRGQTLLIPWKILITNLSLAGLCLLLAVFLWSTPAEMFSIWYEKLSRKRWGRVLRTGSIVLSIALFVFVMVRILEDSDSNSEFPVKFETYEMSTFLTKHYQFTYPLNLRRSAHQLITNSDQVYELTRKFLAAEPTMPVIVDLSEKSQSHLGIAGLYKIRMDIRGNQNLQNRLRVLSHETSHVFALLESNRKITYHDNATHFFNEGMAEYISYLLFPDNEKLKSSRLLAAAAWQRHAITFDQLADKTLFLKKHDESLFYALGETWVNSLAMACGKSSIGDVIRSMGRPEVPRDLNAQALWQDAFQSMNKDLEKVNGFWLKQMKGMVADRKEEMERLPRISGGISQKDDKKITFVAHLDRPILNNSYIFIIQYRNDSEDIGRKIFKAYGVVRPGKEPVEIEFTIPGYHLIGRRFEFQFGYIFKAGTYPYFEQWQSEEYQ